MFHLLIPSISLPLTATEQDAIAAAKAKLGTLCPRSLIRDAHIYKRSVDARKRDRIRLVYSVMLSLASRPKGLSDEKMKRLGVSVYEETDLTPEMGTEPMEHRPVVVGFGPGGMLCALMLARSGYRPIVLERGEDLERREADVAHFHKTGILNPSSNVQFGAGGAGTFSDGKLVTRIGDPRLRFVLRTFVEKGAPEEILVQAKPHIGTDRLRSVVAGIRDEILSLGGEIRFGTCLKDVVRDREGRITSLITDGGDEGNGGDLPCSALVLAIGHSARDTYAMLARAGIAMAPKPFSVGVRIEHLQHDIDVALFGDLAGHPALGKGEYALSRRVGEEAVYTFCMCPGGSVMAAASEEGGVVTNGMSLYARDGLNANAALVVSVCPENGVEFQRSLERRAFEMAGGGYRAPMQTVGDFLSGRMGSEPGRIRPSYREGCVTPCDLHELFPSHISEMLEMGLRDFDGKLRGFACPDAILTGVESRTSAPLRILRDERLCSVSCPNLYPCGEGAGYAGGISSAAVDGISCAMALMKRFAPIEG